MYRAWKERSAVYLVTTTAEFVPNSVWSWPDGFEEASIHVKNVTLTDARATVRAFNKAAMERRAANVPGWNRKWAIAACCVRAKGWDRDRRAVVVKGGAA